MQVESGAARLRTSYEESLSCKSMLRQTAAEPGRGQGLSSYLRALLEPRPFASCRTWAGERWWRRGSEICAPVVHEAHVMFCCFVLVTSGIAQSMWICCAVLRRGGGTRVYSVSSLPRT